METEKELNEKETAQVMGGEADKFVECPESLTKPVKTICQKYTDKSPLCCCIFHLSSRVAYHCRVKNIEF